jgi:tetratricopeptide (TPR) repeat protein
VGLLYWLLAAYTAGTVIFFLFARYRFPLVLLLLPFAAFALVEAPRRWQRGRERRGLLGAALGAAVCAVVVNLPVDQTPDGFRVSTHANAANALIESGRYDRALEHLEASLELAPDYPNAHLLLGVVLSEEGRLTEAEAHFRIAIAGDPENAVSYYGLGNALVWQERFEEGITQYRRALELDPTDALIYGALGTALARTGRLEQAVDLLEQGLELDPYSTEILFNLGLALRFAHQEARARVVINRLLALEPDHLGALHQRVALALAAGEVLEARAHLEEIVQRHPDDLRAHLHLGWLLVSHPDDRVRDEERGLTIARRLSADGQQSNPQTLDLLAAAYANAGRFDQALTWATRAAELATAAGQTSLAADIESRAQGYARREPYRAGSATGSRVP